MTANLPQTQFVKIHHAIRQPNAILQGCRSGRFAGVAGFNAGSAMIARYAKSAHNEIVRTIRLYEASGYSGPTAVRNACM